jgi:hypothetical protein
MFECLFANLIQTFEIDLVPVFLFFYFFTFFTFLQVQQSRLNKKKVTEQQIAERKERKTKENEKCQFVNIFDLFIRLEHDELNRN